MNATRTDAYRDDVQLAHWLLSSRSSKNAVLTPEQIAFALDQTPRSMGRDIMFLRFWQRGLVVPGGRLFDVHGIPQQIKFGDRELSAYKLTAFMAEQYSEAHALELEPVTCHRIASAVLSEICTGAVCTNCNTVGCDACQWLGTVAWTDHRRRTEIDTTQRRWEKPLGAVYRSTVREAVNVGRQAALAFAGVARQAFPEQWGVLLREFAVDP